MKQLKTYKTTTFADGDFRIDVTEKRDEFEAYLYHKDYAVKDLMFGSPKKNFRFGETIRMTMDMFMELVESNLPDYKENYLEMHF